MPYRVPATLDLSETEQAELEGWARRRKMAQALALRARIVLRAAAGSSNTAIAAELGIAKHTVGKWRERFAKDRLEGLQDQPRSGAPRTVTDERVAGLLVRTLEAAPEDATHWSTRSMAAACGLSPATVQRIWRASGLKPHRTEGFALSSDPEFAAKVRDIVGLYLNPPDRALVLCVDEKTEMQALERTQPVLPMRPGQPERRSSDYIVMARPRCSPPWTCGWARWSAAATGGTGPRSSAPSWRPWTRSCRPTSRCTWSSTTPRSTRPRRCGPGSPGTPATTCTSPRRQAPG